MSYGLSVVIQKNEDRDAMIPFIFIGGFDGMNWHMAKHEESPERRIQALNNACKKVLREQPDGQTSINRLMTAPLDEVVVITGESTYESLPGRTPISSKGVDIIQYLTNF